MALVGTSPSGATVAADKIEEGVLSRVHASIAVIGEPDGHSAGLVFSADGRILCDYRSLVAMVPRS